MIKGYACLSITLTINVLLAWGIGASFRKSDCEYYLPIMLFDFLITYSMKYGFGISFNFADWNFDVKKWLVWGVMSKVVLSGFIFMFESSVYNLANLFIRPTGKQSVLDTQVSFYTQA
jgi:hypothetical protein